MEGQAVSADDVPMGTQHTTPDTTKYRELLAERLRITRRLLEPRQEDAARKVGLTPDVWSEVEQGIHPVDPYLLALFAIQYRVDAWWLLLGDPEGLDPPLLQALSTVPEAMRYFRDLSPPAGEVQ
jgi:transcriptional regulator with XRE-family HTH domain